MKFQLFDTQTRTKQTVQCEKGKTFGTYCCGPTVYGPAHIGNFRTYVVQDTIVRLLKLLKIPYRYVRNITDVDDKTIRNSIAQKQKLSDYVAPWIEKFHGDCKRLNLLPPTVEPCATETIAEQQQLIQILIDTHHAYVRDGSVYFRIASFENYGRLSHLDTRILQTQTLNSAGRSNDADEYDREQVADFVLWKAWKPADGDVSWESPWGRGRPGWHIECSAMSHLYLGQTVDLHTGGVDLCFPHHENEIAQSEAAYGAPFVRQWLHIAHLQIEGQKMSKSLGNLLTLDDLQARGYPPSAVRYALSAGHYRQTLNFTFDLVHSAKGALQKINTCTQTLLSQSETNKATFENLKKEAVLPENCSYLGDFFEALLDDLNVPKALGCLFTFLHQNPLPSKEHAKNLLNEWCAALYALGIEYEAAETDKVAIEIPENIQALAEQRWSAKQSRQFCEADRLRQVLTESGWNVLDRKDTYILEPLKK